MKEIDISPELFNELIKKIVGNDKELEEKLLFFFKDREGKCQSKK